MTRRDEHDDPETLLENQAETPHEAEQAARSLEDAVDSHGTLEGYYAMNNEKPPKEVVEEIDSHRKTKTETA